MMGWRSSLVKSILAFWAHAASYVMWSATGCTSIAWHQGFPWWHREGFTPPGVQVSSGPPPAPCLRAYYSYISISAHYKTLCQTLHVKNVQNFFSYVSDRIICLLSSKHKAFKQWWFNLVEDAGQTLEQHWMKRFRACWVYMYRLQG